MPSANPWRRENISQGFSRLARHTISVTRIEIFPISILAYEYIRGYRRLFYCFLPQNILPQQGA
jgi:hypothetical protein